jgi:hypothetical protein
MVRTRLASGDLVQVRRGVYVRAAMWPSDAKGRHIVSTRAELTLHTSEIHRRDYTNPRLVGPV